MSDERNIFRRTWGRLYDTLEPTERDVILLHIVFSIVCGFTLIIPSIFIPIGIKLFFLVLMYNIIVPLVALLRKYELWLDLWVFAFILSILQIFPDWFLSAQLGVLVFPEDGFVKIGTVSAYMAGLWTIPLFIIVFLGLRINIRYKSKLLTYSVVGITTLLIFGLSEQTLWILPSWNAQNVQKIGFMAIYIIIPELILGLSTFSCYNHIQQSKLWVTFVAAFTVMLLYLGSAVFFYFVIETVIFGFIQSLV